MSKVIEGQFGKRNPELRGTDRFHPTDEPKDSWRPCEEPDRELDEHVAFSHGCPGCRLRMGELLIEQPNLMVMWGPPWAEGQQPYPFRTVCQFVAWDFSDERLMLTTMQPILTQVSDKATVDLIDALYETVDEVMRKVDTDALELSETSKETLNLVRSFLTPREEHYERLRNSGPPATSPDDEDTSSETAQDAPGDETEPEG